MQCKVFSFRKSAPILFIALFLKINFGLIPLHALYTQVDNGLQFQL